jgi:large repetitive protein
MKDAGSKHRLNTRSPNNPSPLFPRGAAMLAVALCFLGSRKRRCPQIVLLLAVSAIGLSLFTGCGSSSASATPTITWATPAAVIYDTALSATQLDATASVPGTFVYSPALGTVLTNVGPQTLSVTFTPTDATGYTTATASVTLMVNMATPTITWATPATIAYDTPLSATQLDATANVAGTFVYSPVSGTVLTPGSQTLSVTFTPTNTTDYNTAASSVTLMVIPTAPAFSLAAGYYGSAQTVAISDSTPAVTIYYTTNGSTPTSSSAVYSTPINVGATETLNAIAIGSGTYVSALASGIYNILLPTAVPTFSPVAGTYGSEQTVTISDTTPKATIYYSISGATPIAYTGPITVSVSETLTAIALATGNAESARASAGYIITGCSDQLAAPTE